MEEDREYLFQWDLLLKAEFKFADIDSVLTALFSRVYLEDAEFWIDSKMKDVKLDEQEKRTPLKRPFYPIKNDTDTGGSFEDEDESGEAAEMRAKGLPTSFGTVDKGQQKKQLKTTAKEQDGQKYVKKYGKMLYKGYCELYQLCGDENAEETDFYEILQSNLDRGATLTRDHSKIQYFYNLAKDHTGFKTEDEFINLLKLDVLKHNAAVGRKSVNDFKRRLNQLHFVAGFSATDVARGKMDVKKWEAFPSSTEQKWIDYNIPKEEFVDHDAPVVDEKKEEVPKQEVEDLKNFDFSFDPVRDAHLVAKDAMNYFGNDVGMKKYWVQRYRLFSKLNDGILLDEESWFSVTPEMIAVHIADRMVFKENCIILDCFTGAGGNAIQFAKKGAIVYAIDMDPLKIRLARQNAKVYGVEDKIQFFCGNAFHIIDSFVRSRKNKEDLPFDAVFLSPPWGGPEYLREKEFTLDMCTPDGYEIFDQALRITDNIVYFLPRNTRTNDLVKLSGKTARKRVDNEQQHLNCKTKTLTAYYGDYVPS